MAVLNLYERLCCFLAVEAATFYVDQSPTQKPPLTLLLIIVSLANAAMRACLLPPDSRCLRVCTVPVKEGKASYR